MATGTGGGVSGGGFDSSLRLSQWKRVNCGQQRCQEANKFISNQADFGRRAHLIIRLMVHII